MGCGTCSSGGCTPAGCKSNGSCLTDGGCSKLDVYDWLADMENAGVSQPFQLVEVRFKGARKEFFQNTESIYLEQGDPVVVETGSSGYDLGHVSLTGELVRIQLRKKKIQDTAHFKKIYRKAQAVDIAKWQASKLAEHDAMHKARKIALSLNLSMKLSDVELQADKTKATFYYTADDRVDFRELIKKLAEEFRVRIEMCQIGMRQEASRLGGIGSCGRELCCSTWLTEFKSVSTSAARYQNLSLNTLKLAGQCGKLKCCLNYELDTYIDALKDIPTRVDHIETMKGTAKLQKTDIFKKIMWFSLVGEENWVPVHVSKVNELIEQNKKGIKPEALEEAPGFSKPVSTKILDFENVGKESLTRFDEKSDRNKKKKRMNRQKNKKAKA